MKSDFKLVGISRERSATLEFLDSDRETFWSDKKIAEVEHVGFNSDGTPEGAILKGIREWDIK